MGNPSGEIHTGSTVLAGFSVLRREVQNLIKSFLECDQAPRNEFIASACEFMRMANIKYFRQALVGIEADTIPVGDGDEHKVEKFFQTG